MHKTIKPLLAIPFVVLMACNPGSGSSNMHAVPDSLSAARPSLSDTAHDELAGTPLRLVLTVNGKNSELVLETMVNDASLSQSNSRDQDLEACGGWHLNKADLPELFQKARTISGTETDLSFADMPCGYVGTCTLDGKQAKYTINAGAHAVIFFGDSSIYLGFFDQSIQGKFLSGPNEE